MNSNVGSITRLKFDGERYLHRQSRRLYMRGHIGEYEIDELVSDLDLIADRVGDGKWIDIHIQTPGGSVHYGLELIKAIKRVQRKGWKIRGIVDGVCMSMGFHILQFCDERVMGSGDLLMAHGITMLSFFDEKDARDIDADRKVLQYWKEFFRDQVVKRKMADGSEEDKEKERIKWDGMLHSKVYIFFTTEEALKENLIDRIEY